MAYYNCLLFDSDNTLLDFDACQRRAVVQMLENFNLPMDDATQERFLKIERESWSNFNRNGGKKEKMLVDRFSRFLKELDVEGNPGEMNRFYLEQLSLYAPVYPEVPTALRELAEVATIAIITNAVTKVQQPRLQASGLMPYIDAVYISETMGVAKPSSKYFAQVLRDLGVENSAHVLVVGDDLEADITGGKNAGLATCWVNRNGQTIENGVKPDFTIENIEELYRIVMEPEELANVGSKNRKHTTDL